jgi:hypothetical protein
MARISTFILALALFAAWPLQAPAETTAAPAAAEADGPDLDLIRSQQKELREMAVAGSGPFDGFSDVKRQEIVDKQDALLSILNGRASFEDMTHAQKIQAFNTLEWIKAAINNTEGDQLVCDYEVRTGSHRRTRRCETLEERRRARDESKQYWQQNLQRAFCWNQGVPCGST